MEMRTHQTSFKRASGERAKVGYGLNRPVGLNDIYRLRISITTFEPEIWRRVYIPDYTLFRFAKVIRAAMGWTWGGGREWLFDDGADENFGVDPYDGSRRKVSRFVREGINPFFFFYGLGDYHWEHKVVVEGVVRRNKSVRYPRCTAGENACPPDEHELGPSEYKSVCHTLENPRHEHYEGTLEWLGQGFDPRRFRVRDANDRLALL